MYVSEPNCREKWKNILKWSDKSGNINISTEQDNSPLVQRSELQGENDNQDSSLATSWKIHVNAVLEIWYYSL